MIRRPKPQKFHLHRTMMFMNTQKPGPIKDAYIYGADNIVLDLEDAVVENQEGTTRSSLYQASQNVDYGNIEVIVYINGFGTSYWQEDIRCVVAGGTDGIRITRYESVQDVLTVEEHVLAAEGEFGVEEGRTPLMTALEGSKGILNVYEIITTSDHMLGCAILGGDFHKSMCVQIEEGGIEMLTARGQTLLAARATDVQYFDAIFLYLGNAEDFQAGVVQNRKTDFDGKNATNPKQTRFVHETFAPTPREIVYAEKLAHSFDGQAESGVRVYTVGGKTVGIPFFEDARRVIALAKACGAYKGDL